MNDKKISPAYGKREPRIEITPVHELRELKCRHYCRRYDRKYRERGQRYVDIIDTHVTVTRDSKRIGHHYEKKSHNYETYDGLLHVVCKILNH